MRLFLALLLLVVSACSSAAEGWRGDERFTPEQRVEIEAANVWEAERMGTTPIHIEWTHIEGGCDHAILVADLPEKTIGTSSPNGCVMIDVEQGADRVGVIFAHELGHVRGLVHHEGPGLMNPIVPPSLTWSDADQAELDAR